MRFVVETETTLYGPFTTADEAALWARKEFPLARWCIRLVHPARKQ